jgi:hypothetical protein
MRRETTFKVLVGAWVVLLLVPMAQRWWWKGEELPLGGAYQEVPLPTWSWDSFERGTFQSEAEQHAKTQVGYYTTLVRWFNEWRWTLLHTTNKGLTRGSGEVVFEDSYGEAALGVDFVGQDSARARVALLQVVADTLARRNIAVVLAIAPGKAEMRRSDWSRTWQRFPQGETNLSTYNKLLKNSSINYVSLYDWLLEVDDTLSYPLYPDMGIHIARRAEFWVADTLVKAMSHAMNTHLPTLRRGDVHLARYPEGRDYDVAQAMNLWCQRDMELKFVDYQYQREGADTTARVLVVADSYYWEMFNNGLSAKALNGGSFWYYSAVAYPESYQTHTEVGSLDLKAELEQYRGILIFTTDANLKQLAFEFPEQVAQAYGIPH